MLSDQLLFTTLIFDEDGISLYKSGFDTPKRKVSEIFIKEELEKLTDIDSVRVNKIFDEEVKVVLKDKTINSLAISGGIAENEATYGLSGIKKIHLLNIAGQEIPDMFPYPKSINVFWAPEADLRAGVVSPIGASIVNIVDAKLPSIFYINDTCSELRINANDLKKVVIPDKISKLALVGGTLSPDFDMTKFPGLREVCFNGGVKLPPKLYIPDGVKIDIGNFVDLSQAQRIEVNYATTLKSPNLSEYLKSKKILSIRKTDEDKAMIKMMNLTKENGR